MKTIIAILAGIGGWFTAIFLASIVWDFLPKAQQAIVYGTPHVRWVVGSLGAVLGVLLVRFGKGK